MTKDLNVTKQPARLLRHFTLVAGIVAVLFGFNVKLIAGGTQVDMTIENSDYQVQLSPEDGHFQIVRKGLEDCSIHKGAVDGEFVSVEKTSVSDPVFGLGKALNCVNKDGAVTGIMLFKNVPFVAIRKSLYNQTSEQLRINKCPVVSLDVSFDKSADALMTRGTAGLEPLGKQMGSYVFGTIADPETGSGVISAWVSFNRGSGMVFYGRQNDKVTLKSRIDYGDLRLNPGQKETGELLFVGLFDDVCLGLEQFAEGVKAYYDIKLRDLPSVYCTWYHARASDEKRLAQNVDFVDENLKDYGLSVMQIDDYWQPGVTFNGPKKNFDRHDPEGPYPSGMKATADNIKKHGLVPGIWFMPFAGSWNDPFFADKQDLFYKVGKGHQGQTREVAKKAGIEIKDIEQTPYCTRWGGTCIDMSNPKSRQYLRQIVDRIAHDWGYEYFKMDGLWTGTATEIRYTNNAYRDDDLGKALRHDPMVTPIEAYRMGLDVLRDAAGEDVFFLGCCMVQNCRSFGASFGGFDAMRVGPDNGSNHEFMIRGPRYSTRYYFLNKRVWYNDPDPMYFRSGISLDGVKLLATWVTLSGTLGASSYDYYKLPAERLDVLKRTMPSHTSKESRPLDFMKEDVSHSWLLKDDSSGVQRVLVGHYNWDLKKEKVIETKLADLGLDPERQYIGFDYWGDQFIRPFSGSIRSGLSAFSGRSIAIYPVKDHPQLVSTSRHITQGIVDVKKEKWSWSSLKLTCEVVAGEPYEMRVAVPTGKSWVLDKVVLKDAPAGTTSRFVQDGPNIRVILETPVSGPVKSVLKFKKGMVSLPRLAEITELLGFRQAAKINLTWKTLGTQTGFELIRNDGKAVRLSANKFTDFDITYARDYSYTLKVFGWDGRVVARRTVEVKPDASLGLLSLPPKPDVSITSLEPKGNISTGWGSPQKNKSASGSKLVIDGKEYKKGYGVHANSSMRFVIPKNAKRFVAVAGVDAAMKDREATSIQFKILGDVREMGETVKVLAESPMLKNSTIVKWHFNIELDERLKEIVLLVEDGGDGINSDHANWCNAGFIVSM